MKKILTTLTLLLTLCPFMFGQSDNYWQVENPTLYPMVESVVAVVYVDNVQITDADIEIATFCGERVSAVSRISPLNPPIYFQHYAILTLRGNPGDIFTFKLYDHKTNTILNCKSETTLQYVNGLYSHGSFKDPIKIYFNSDDIAKIGETKFPTLAAACEAAQDGETVTLIKDATDNGAVINKDITLDFNGKTYTITEGNSIEIAEGGVLTVVEEGGMNIAGEGKLVINGGQLYHSIEGVNATVKKTFTPQSYWNTISAPIVGGAAIPTNATHDLYRYDEVEHEWEYYLDADGMGFSTLELGRGYLYAAGENDITVELNGELNVADVEFPLSYTEGNELKGFNLIGNPFTHNINENNFSASALSQGYYVISENGEWLSRYDGEETIEPMQSVLVQTTAANSSVKISKQVAATTRNASEGSLKINVNGNNCQDVAYVSFNEGISLDKISHNNSTSAMLYITSEGKDYAVATMSKDVTEIPVSFKAMTMGEYTISVEAQHCEFETLYLKDMLTGASINLNTDSYTFMATSNDEPNRFVLTTTEPTGIESNTLEAFVYINNSEIIINNIQGHAQVSIIDIMGRTVAKYNVFESAVISTSSLEKGVYIIQMTDANGIRTQKAIID